ncbi:PD-(D/E)XK motif protein [Luteimonas fraxinea]|uniref:PD-(D/E)XK motif protein n=1 Tax=Luteimonas fraxinea TaxID=2901869 RepID=A0ABS8U8V4_9GAMM|nr:PD-(D/E)XK motif protein [Luteimonas fraxinea]MCD9095357.1 PD-(D/E)XK motif protein [Luteimonas fraxinea]UHH11429.1 PD-(D/E)XK motif protein [Luteimonas fraxinea]
MHEDPWARIEPADHLVGHRIAEDHPLAVYWTRRHDGARGVLFKHAHAEQLPTERPLLEGIVVEIGDAPSLSVALYLSDETHHEVFDLMCRDIIEASSRAVDTSHATAAIFRRLDHWQAMLAEGRSNDLTTQQVRGLMGELWFLDQIAARRGVAAGISAYVAPDDHPQDFALPLGLVEVKARLAGSCQQVSISSLDQLEAAGIPLVLLVVEFIPDMEGGSLNDVVDGLNGQANEAGAAWEARLRMSLLRRDYTRSDRYNGQRYRIGAVRAFHVERQFPRLVRSTTDMRVLGASYLLDLTGLGDFEVEPYSTIARLLG